MKPYVFFAVFSFATAFCGLAQTPSKGVGNIANVEFRLDERVFAVMSALHAAGYDSGLDWEKPGSVRRLVLADFSRQHLSATLSADLRRFFTHWNVELDTAKQQPKYIALSQLLGFPPAFAYHGDARRPPAAVKNIAGFGQLTASWWDEARGETAWKKWRPTALDFLASLKSDMHAAILAVLRFARTRPRIVMNRRIVVVPNLVDAPGLFNAIHQESTYTLIVSPTSEKDLYVKHFIHEYLHFQLDPILDEAAAKLDSDEAVLAFVKERGEYASYSPYLSNLVKESVYNAVELAIVQGMGQRAGGLRDEMIRRDSPFLPYFEKQIRQFAAGGQALDEWVSDWVKRGETREMCLGYQAPSAPPTRGDPGSEIVMATPGQEADARLAEADLLIQQGRLDEAQSALAKLGEPAGRRAESRFLTGKLRYAQNDFAGALALFNASAGDASAPEWVRAWSWLKAGNCLVRLDRRGEAEAAFQKGESVGGSDRGAADAARRALKQLRETGDAPQ